MSRKHSRYRKFSKISVFVLIQSVIFISAFLIYILSHDSIVCFYALLISFTIMAIMMLEMIAVFIYNLIKSPRIKDKIFALSMVCLFSLASGFIIWGVSKYYKDVPYALRKDYKVVSGECTYVYAYYGRASHLDMTVGNIEFNVTLGYKDSIKKGDFYKVVYLPNTKEVISIYGR